MARKNKIEKLQDIDLQIQKMKEEKAKLLETLERQIGKTVIKEWDSYDEEAIIEFIKLQSENARQFLDSENNTNEHSPIEQELQSTNNY